MRAERYDEGVKHRRFATGLTLFALFTAIGLLLTVSGYLADLAQQHYGTMALRLTEEMVGSYTALALLPFIIWFARRFRLRAENWVSILALTIAAALLYSGVHTTINALGRDLVSRLTGQGPYDYGIMFYRYPMEAAKDVLYFTIFVMSINFIDGLKTARQAEIAAAELQTKLADAKIENLQLQLHPHFLFNTLNAISSVMYEDVPKADEMLSKLSDFLRTVLGSSGVHEVPLAQELAVEHMYVDIMKTRLERNLALDVHVDEAAQGALVPFMLLQPLLENSIRHGMADARSSIALDIAVQRRNGSLVIELCDDGCGFTSAKTGGIGLRNVASRLEHLYGDGAYFSIEPRYEGGTRATMIFPFAGGSPA